VALAVACKTQPHRVYGVGEGTPSVSYFYIKQPHGVQIRDAKPCNCPHRAENRRNIDTPAPNTNRGVVVKIFRRDDFPCRAHVHRARPGQLPTVKRCHKRGKERLNESCPVSRRKVEANLFMSYYHPPGNLCAPSDNTQIRTETRSLSFWHSTLTRSGSSNQLILWA
jgi:hypothetical protein